MEENKSLQEPKVYTAEEIQQILQLKRSTLYHFLEDAYKKQPFKILKIGKQYRIIKESFDDWLQNS